jgi:hypothetical protein
MEAWLNGNDENNNLGFQSLCALHIHEVVVAAHEELRRLLQRRAELMKRIRVIKQLIVGLHDLVGGDTLSGDIDKVANQKAGVPRLGLTQACRMVLMRAGRAVKTRQVCEQIQQAVPDSPIPKNLVNSVEVVLNRLVQYGEARRVLSEDGRRAWLWVSDAEAPSSNLVTGAESSVSQA